MKYNTDTPDLLTVKREMGGLKAFEETGVYPDTLVFRSSKLKKRWRRKVYSENQTGSIKSGVTVIFNYRLVNDCCEVQFIQPDGTTSEWIPIDMLLYQFD